MSLQDFTDRFVPREEVLHLTGIRSPSTIYALIKDGDFPAPYEITRGRKGWSFTELQDWIASRKKEARNG
jgi:predicted DNA-binding transcriptional regulator AlpA